MPQIRIAGLSEAVGTLLRMSHAAYGAALAGWAQWRQCVDLLLAAGWEVVAS